ncbi:hypothetical protein TPHA_0J01860 [Tetrapisispora phaffii CBS 4417]|uniref:Vacuolar fusion protein MON1 n=1 Tax=Tetrapisispora phaffii (strain ATCC 24235 / CBS 4417 / NBRC 1672 / NRRL Y-8282 / UCD 70-5) TaxID=1071381 RepID=G8BYR5_TETPH|nr:hypothetical protein TPHA_0J01860 [Tetrapisispora phaffii CBS 4417]CCE65007.1 hypothetical protein TPHA_0J01860 [Tetrapisispora phaffii CBS 4417]
MSLNITDDYLDNAIPNTKNTIKDNNENNLTISTSRSTLPTTSINLEKTLFQQQLLRQENNSSGIRDIDTINGSIVTSASNATRTRFLDNLGIKKPSFANLHDDISSTYTVNSNFKRSFVSSEIPSVFVNYQSYEERTESKLNKIQKNFFMLTAAGKLIYSYLGKERELISLMGILNTIVDFFKINNNKDIQTIKYDSGSLVFLNKSPIILVGYTKKGESTSEISDQLDFLYSYLISSLTEKQIVKLFDKRENFDLRNYLEASDFTNLNELCSLLTDKLYPDVHLGALESLPFKDSNIRNKIHDLMSKHLLKESDLSRGILLYGLLVYPNNKLISVLRPKSHTLHTTDLQLLFYSIFHRFKTKGDNNRLDIDDNSNKELWIPMCFPKFNSKGFLYCYINFITNEDSTKSKSNFSCQNSLFDDRVPALVLISPQKDAFFDMKKLATNLINDMVSKNLLSQIKYSNGFSVTDIPAPLVHHFIYKSNSEVQYIQPTSNYNNYLKNLVNPTKSLEQYHAKLRIFYQQLYSSIARDATGTPMNKSTLNFISWEQKEDQDMFGSDIHSNGNSFSDYRLVKEEQINVMGMIWVTPKFELYLLCNNGVNNKEVIFKSAKNIAKWCNNNKLKLFVTDGVIF